LSLLPTVKVAKGKNIFYMMKQKDFIILTLLVGLGFLAGGVMLESARLYGNAYDLITQANFSTALQEDYDGVSASAALAKDGVALYPGAQRLTFTPGAEVTYRVPETADKIVSFYSQILPAQGWEELENEYGQLTYVKGEDELTIKLEENPLSKKTVTTYAFAPTSAVLGIKLAQETAPLPADSSGSVPMDQTSQPANPQSGGCPNLMPVAPCDNGRYECNGGAWQCVASSQPNQPSQQQPYQNNQPNQYQQPYQQNKFDQQNATQTCRVNGVEMPGSCDNYNQPGQMGQNQLGQGNQMGQNGQMGPGGEGMGQQGPSEEQMQKMDEQRFKQMKQGLNQFSKGATQMKKMLAQVQKKVTKCGVGIPEELTNALAAADGIVTKIKAAQTADELDEIITDVEDVGSVMQEWGPQMGELNRVCQMITQADRDAKKLDQDVKRLTSRVKANKKIDLTEALAAFQQEVTALKQVITDAKTLAKTDPLSALDKIETEFYGEMDNIQSSRMAVETALNISQGLKDVAREIKSVETQIKNLKKKKIDTAGVEELLTTMKSQVAELQSLIKTKFDPEELISLVESAYDTRQQIMDLIQELSGTITYMPNIKADTKMNVNVNLPDVFQKQQQQDNSADNMGGGGMGF